jgi:hypothetical protein
MENKKIWQIAVLDGVLTGIYVAGVATIMTFGEIIFGKGDNAFVGMAILMLFVLSAVVVGSLILGRPLMMYLDGNKKEAVKTLGYTILVLFVLTITAMVILAIKN